jgi:hypothetical protein
MASTQRVPLNAAAWTIFDRWARLALRAGDLQKVIAISEIARRAARALPVDVVVAPAPPRLSSPAGAVVAFTVVADTLVGCLIAYHRPNDCATESASAFTAAQARYFSEGEEAAPEASWRGIPLLARLVRSSGPAGIIVLASDPFQPLLPASVLLGSENAGHAVAYSSSIQSAISFLEGPSPRVPPPSGQIVVLNAEVPTAVLPGAREEAMSLVRAHGAKTVAGRPLDQLAALEDLPDGTLIHFGGHARVNPDYPHLSTLEFTDGEAVVPITVAQIMKLRLPKRSVVVLAGCDTAAWGGRRGPVTSLAAAFVDAGAEAVVSTTRVLPDAQAAACLPLLEEAIARNGAVQALAAAVSSPAQPCRSLLSDFVAVVG